LGELGRRAGGEKSVENKMGYKNLRIGLRSNPKKFDVFLPRSIA